MKARAFLLLNFILLVPILAILFLRLNKKEIIVEAKIGSEPTLLLETLEKHKINFNSEFNIIFIFSRRPLGSSLESTDKLYHIFNKHLDFCVIFSNYYRLKKFFQFPRYHLTKYKFHPY